MEGPCTEEGLCRPSTTPVAQITCKKHKTFVRLNMVKEAKGWSRASLDQLVQNVDAYGTTDRHSGSGRPKSVRTTDNIARRAADLICRQNDEVPDLPCGPKNVIPLVQCNIISLIF